MKTGGYERGLAEEIGLSALHVIYLSCDDDAGIADRAYERIAERWREAP